MAKNLWGEDQVTYQVLVLMAPDAPNLELLHTTSRTIHLRWKASDDGGTPIQGETLIISHIIPNIGCAMAWVVSYWHIILEAMGEFQGNCH